MASLSTEIAAYEKMRDYLEADHFGEWVIICDEKLQGAYPTSEEAAYNAVKRFGRGPFLIRHVGEPPKTLPVSVMYRV
ncbi:MAG: hypothetical protein OXG98_20230 [Gemmatimonadetes bacterium]|nr:hypothetical protein [Gemmatimonadota bacterium]